MAYLHYLVEGIFIIGIIALIATIVKYPKNVAKVFFGFLITPFRQLWEFTLFIFLPFGLLIIFIEAKLGVNYLTRLIDRESSETKEKTQKRKEIDFQKFNKYIVVNSTSVQIEDELKEANQCCPGVNIKNLNIWRTEEYAVLETPENGFYGYNFLIQWLTNNLKGDEIVGFAANGRTSFITISNKDGDNDLIGRTNAGMKFWVSMYDDLDDKQFLRLHDGLILNSKLTTKSLDKMVKNAFLKQEQRY